MDLRKLRYLVALARERHFGRAAAAENVSQPSLSAAIRQLEDDFGVAIVERGQRFVGFTAEGERVLAHARRVLADHDGLRQDLSRMAGGLAGRLRIGCVPTALPVVAALTTPFSERYPDVTYVILSHSSQGIQGGLDDFALDVGITYLDNEPLAGVRSQPLYFETYVLLTRADGPLGGRDTVGWAEAATLPLCLLTSDMQNRRIIATAFRRAGTDPVPAIETNSIVNLYTHVRFGPLASVVSSQMVRVFQMPPDLAAIPLVEPTTAPVMGLVIADRQPVPPLVDAFAGALAATDVPALLAIGDTGLAPARS